MQKTSHPCSTEAALGLYGLAQYDVLHEPASETLAVVGWGGPGHPVVLLSFRGTDNMQVCVCVEGRWHLVEGSAQPACGV